jgi:signal transduction histidine kinase
VLRVADNGPGIPSDLRERVFAPFFTTKADGVGTGVGLALCRAIAQDHGGRIEAEETPGGGATLAVWLPLQDGVVAGQGGPEGSVGTRAEADDAGIVTGTVAGSGRPA